MFPSSAFSKEPGACKPFIKDTWYYSHCSVLGEPTPCLMHFQVEHSASGLTHSPYGHSPWGPCRNGNIPLFCLGSFQSDGLQNTTASHAFFLHSFSLKEVSHLLWKVHPVPYSVTPHLPSLLHAAIPLFSLHKTLKHINTHS